METKAQKNNNVNWVKDSVFICDRQIDKYPSFPGGIEALGKFISKNIKWPKSGDKNTKGTVIVSFNVEKDGSLTSFKIERSVGKGFDSEAIRVLKKSPKWIPAKQNGNSIIVKYFVPIKFVFGESQ